MAHVANFNFQFQHIPGKQNTIADILSRRKDLEEGVQINNNVILLPNALFSRKIYLPDNLKRRQRILKEIHNAPTGGHPGIANTWELVKQCFHGPRLRPFVEQYVKGCAKCQESKVLKIQKAPLFHFDTPIEEGPFQYISMDLITDLPKSKGYDTILTIVD